VRPGCDSETGRAGSRKAAAAGLYLACWRGHLEAARLLKVRPGRTGRRRAAARDGGQCVALAGGGWGRSDGRVTVE
jgi:hypothetical protein